VGSFLIQKSPHFVPFSRECLQSRRGGTGGPASPKGAILKRLLHISKKKKKKILNFYNLNHFIPTPTHRPHQSLPYLPPTSKQAPSCLNSLPLLFFCPLYPPRILTQHLKPQLRSKCSSDYMNLKTRNKTSSLATICRCVFRTKRRRGNTGLPRNSHRFAEIQQSLHPEQKINHRSGRELRT